MRVSKTPFGLAVFGFFVGFALIETALAVAWSEHFRGFSWLYQLLGEWRTERIVASLVSVTLLGWLLDRRAGAACSAILIAALGVFYRSAPPFQPSMIPGPFRIRHDYGMPELVVLCAATAMLASWLVIRSPRIAAGLALLLPVAIHAGGVFGNYWDVFGNGLGWWMFAVLASAGSGLAVIAHEIRAGR